MFNTIMAYMICFLALSFAGIMLFAVIDPEPKQKQPQQ